MSHEDNIAFLTETFVILLVITGWCTPGGTPLSVLNVLNITGTMYSKCDLQFYLFRVISYYIVYFRIEWKTWAAFGRAHTSARLNSLLFVSHWSAGSGSGLQPKCNRSILVTDPNHPPSFGITRPELFEISCSQPNKQTDRGEDVTSIPLC